MNAAGDRPRLRVRIEGHPGLQQDIDPDGMSLAPPAGFQGTVREVGVTGAERAAGLRRFEVTIDGWTLRATVEPEARARLRERAAQDDEARRHHGPHSITAPMAGRVARIWVTLGDTVDAGQRLLAVEAMKMENEIRTPRAGIVESIAVAVGDAVDHGDDLVVLR